MKTTGASDYAVIGVDVGTSVIKCSLVDSRGETRDSARGPSAPLRQPEPGFIETDPDAIFASFCKVVRRVVSRTRERRVLLALSTMTPVFILADGKGRVVRPAILYNDSRTTEVLDELNAGAGRKRFLDVNGNVANVQQWGPKWLWLRRNEPESCRRTARLFDLGSFIVHKLTGEFAIDLTAAQEGGLLDYRTRKWSGELLSEYGVDDSMLPSLKKTTQVVGELTPGARGKLGVARGTTIEANAGCVDAVASSMSIGHVVPDELSFVLGSTGIIAFSTLEPKPDRRLYLDLSPVEGQYFVGGGTAASGLFFDYILDLLKVGEPRYARAERLARACKSGSRGVVMLPYIFGERTPIFDPLAKSVVFGLTPQVKRGEVIRGCMESIAFSFLHHVETLKENGYRTGRFRVTGGAARSRVLLQAFADIMEAELTYYRDASPTVGDALIGFMGQGVIRDWREIDGWIGRGEAVKPDPAKAAAYRKQFRVYLDLYEKLKDDFRLG